MLNILFMTIACDVILLLKVGSNKVALGLNKDDLGSYSRWGFILFPCIEFHHLRITMGTFVLSSFYVNKKLSSTGPLSVNDI